MGNLCACCCMGHSGSSLEYLHLSCSAPGNNHANFKLENPSDCHCCPHSTSIRKFSLSPVYIHHDWLLSGFRNWVYNLLQPLTFVVILFPQKFPSLNAQWLTSSSKYPLLPSLNIWFNWSLINKRWPDEKLNCLEKRIISFLWSVQFSLGKEFFCCCCCTGSFLRHTSSSLWYAGFSSWSTWAL